MRFSASFPHGEKIPPILNPPKKERNYRASILLSLSFLFDFFHCASAVIGRGSSVQSDFGRYLFFFLRFFSKMFKCNLQNTIFQLLKSLLPEESFVINFTRRILYSINRNFFKIFYQQFLESILIEIVIQGKLNRKKKRKNEESQTILKGEVLSSLFIPDPEV